MATVFTALPTAAASGPLAADVSLQMALGSEMETADGRKYLYTLNGGVDMVAGKLYQAAAQIANHHNLAVVADVAVATNTSPISIVTVTLGGTAVTANQYAGGFLSVRDGSGAGLMYQIASHPAQSNGSGNVAITLADPITVALTSASSKVDLTQHPNANVIVNPTTATAAPIGVAVFAVPAGQFGWLQVEGPALVLNQGGTTVGLPVGVSASVAGAVATTTGAAAPIGIALETGTDGKYCMVDLHID